MRILLLELPKLLRDILERAIRLREGLEVMRDTRPMFQTLRESGPVPDVVVLGLTAEDDAPLVPVVMSRWPLARVITVSDGGTSIEIAHLDPHGRKLLEPTPDAIVDWFDKAMVEAERPH